MVSDGTFAKAEIAPASTTAGTCSCCTARSANAPVASSSGMPGPITMAAAWMRWRSIASAAALASTAPSASTAKAVAVALGII